MATSAILRNNVISRFRIAQCLNVCNGKLQLFANYSTENGPTDKSIVKKKSIKTIPDAEIKKSVFISQSYDVYTNLALEDWIYKNYDFTNHHVLMLWANDPCVVVGRHQNPFTETNVSALVEKGIALARRNSGGGAVYHDRGNLNCTFFMPRERYDRKYNLNLITRALFREWNIKAELNKRDDIVIQNKKVNTLIFSLRGLLLLTFLLFNFNSFCKLNLFNVNSTVSYFFYFINK